MSVAVAVDTIKPQRLRALDYANEVRVGKADRKRDIKRMKRREAAVTIASWVTSPTHVTGAFTVAEALGAIRGIGDQKVRNLCFRCKCQTDRRLDALYDHQRKLLRGELAKIR